MKAGRRSLVIFWTILRYRLDLLIPPETLSRLPARFRWPLQLLRLLPGPRSPDGARLRDALTALGPVFIKFGQLLSTRHDLLTKDITFVLAELQDRVPPFAEDQALGLIANALNSDLEEHFQSVDSTPIASASVAQVHGAILRDGSAVVIKVLRPGVEAIIEQDMGLLDRLASSLDRLSRDFQRLHLPAVVADQRRILLAELDLRLEASNTRRLRENFVDSPLLYVPQVFEDLCRRNVLVVERIHGIPISDVAALRQCGTNLKLLADRGVETFFTQVFVHNFFHADMHPGNIFVDVTEPQNPSYIAVDCAIIGSLTEADQDYLARNLLAFFHQDYAAVARLLLESGWIPPDTDTNAFERVIRELCEPLFAKPLNEIFFGEFLVVLFQTARDFNMEIQPQLVLLQKTLLYIEGVGRELYPELDLWATAKPFMERWMAQRTNPIQILGSLFQQVPAILPQLSRFPRLITDSANHIRHLNSQMGRQAESLEQLHTQLRSSRKYRLVGAILLGIGALLIWNADNQLPLPNGDLSTTAALISALFGTMLLLRA